MLTHVIPIDEVNGGLLRRLNAGVKRRTDAETKARKSIA
jgi:hypothetical protein